MNTKYAFYGFMIMSYPNASQIYTHTQTKTNRAITASIFSLFTEELPMTIKMATTSCFYSKGVTVMLLVNICVYGGYLCKYMLPSMTNVFDSTMLLYPILGWLVDAKIGRYKAIVCSMVLMSVGCVCLAVAWTVFYWYGLLEDNTIVVIVLVLCALCVRTSVNLFITAALPFTTDQMIGASGDQLATSTVVDWYVWGDDCIQAVIQWIPLSIANKMMYTLIVLVCPGLAVSCMLLCHHHLDKQSYITNPIRDIASVLNYARKNKCARNRSALTYWENKAPSRLDLGMEKYGGPFTEEQVEDVKTVLRLLPLMFCCRLVTLSANGSPGAINNRYLNPLFHDSTSQLILFLVPAYYLLIKPLCSIQPVRHYCSKLKMPMLKIIGVGILLKASSFLGYVILDLVSHDVTTANNTCLLTVEANTLGYYNVLILNCINGLGGTLVAVITIKFIVAQTPNKMKGLAFTIYLGLRSTILVKGGISKLFEHYMFPKCGLYYCLTQFLILCAVMVLYVVVSRWYRLRSRNNPINIHHIVETHVARNLDREQEYLRENDNSSLSYGTID